MDEPKHVMNIQGTAHGPIQGEHQTITQNFYDRTGWDWSTRLALACELRPESFKLGDISAAKFPYVIAPVQSAYTHATQALYHASNMTGNVKRGVLILGESNAGKTRLALETLKNTLPDWPVLRWRPDYTKDDIPPTEFLKGKCVVLFLDDLQDYASVQTKDPTGLFFIADPRTITLRTLIEILLQAAQCTVIVATCRIEHKLQIRTALNWLFVQLIVKYG